MTPAQKQFVIEAAAAAKQSGHIFPEMAACEAALESRYGASTLAIRDLNLFGMKQHAHPVYGTHNLPTREFLKGKWEQVSAAWVLYPDWASCFADRMSTLRRLASVYPHYAAALAAKDQASYVTEVSRTWSTDPERGQKVLQIWAAAFGSQPSAIS
jgi:flagellum-specific peptidoglycan hydrolase FlgJ